MMSQAAETVHLKKILDAVPAMIVVISLETEQVVVCNRYFVEVSRLPRDRVTGHPMSHLLPSEHHEKAATALNQARAGVSPIAGVELVLANLPGQQFSVSINRFELDVNGGSYALMTWEVSAEIRPDETVHRFSPQDDSLIQAILDNTNAVIYAKDTLGRYQLVNRRFEKLFGITLAEILGRTDFDVFPAEQAKAFTENDQHVLASNRSIEFEEIAPHTDGLHTYISLKFPSCDEHGKPTGICGISTDITPRKKMEAALQESEQRFRQLAENIRECFWIIDAKTGKVLYVSPAYEQIWGRPRAGVYENPRAWIEAIHPADRERTEQAFLANVTKGKFNEEYRVLRPDGSLRWVSDRGVPVYDENGEVYRIAGMAEDVTERRRLEKQVAEISSHERHRISRELHDSLGQQLTGVGFLTKSLVRRLATRVPTEAERAETILEGIQTAIAEVRGVVRGLAPVELDAYGLRAALRDLARSVAERFAVDCRFNCEADIAVEDNNVATELYRIAQEATNNAVKHARPEHVTIELECTARDLVLRVRDDGCGMAGDGGNNGMGMRIMRYRSKMIGAEFGVFSSPAGTTITCKLKRDPKRGEAS